MDLGHRAMKVAESKDISTASFKRKFSRASLDKTVLLLLDRPASHTKNVDLIHLGHEHGVQTP